MNKRLTSRAAIFIINADAGHHQSGLEHLRAKDTELQAQQKRSRLVRLFDIPHLSPWTSCFNLANHFSQSLMFYSDQC